MTITLQLLNNSWPLSGSSPSDNFL